MDERGPRDIEGLLEELEQEYGAPEPLLPEVEQLLRDLRASNPVSTRQRAIEQLFRLDTSHPRILQTLIGLKEIDESLFIRTLAGRALQAPAHQELLRRHPDLEERVVAEMAPRRGPEAREPLDLPHGATAPGAVDKEDTEKPPARPQYPAVEISTLPQPLPPDVEELLDVLQSDSLYGARRVAADKLGKVETSHPRIVRALIACDRDVSFVDIDSPHGHDAFLIETDRLTKIATAFLDGSQRSQPLA